MFTYIYMLHNITLEVYIYFIYPLPLWLDKVVVYYYKQCYNEHPYIFVPLGTYMSFSGAAVFKVGSTDSLDGLQDPFRVSQAQTVFIVLRLDLPFFTLILS